MKTYAHVTREVDEGHRGRRTAAFFDFDGTLLSGFSVLFFLARRYLKGQVSRSEAMEQFRAVASYGMKRSGFTDVLAEFALSMSGTSDDDMWELADEVFRKDLVGRL